MTDCSPPPRAPAPPQATEQCRVATRQHSKTFYLGSQLFPTPQRQAVWAVYAACREGDDIVDDLPTQEAHEQLDAWWARIEAAYAGRPGAKPVDQALAWAVAAYPVPIEAFAELRDGFLMDLGGQVYDTLPELELYCRRVAGVVGLMIAPIAGYSGGPDTLARALRLGQAMQLTNILRDVGEDLRRGRVYLPRALMAQYGVTPESLQGGLAGQPPTPAYGALMGHLAGVARDWYRQGRAGIPKLRGSAPLAVGVAARAYEGILDDLARHDFDNFQHRAYVSGSRKLLMLPRVWWELRLAGP